MRIIDGNKDYYDFWQNIWRDDSVTFDRRDSYDLSKEEFASTFFDGSERWSKWVRKKLGYNDSHKLVLLQVCNNFWLFELYITKTGCAGICEDYELHLIEAWQDYTKPSELIRLSAIVLPLFNRTNGIDAIKRGEYEVKKVYNEFLNIKSKGSDITRDVRHIPILKNIGIAAEVPSEQIFRAIEEYFMIQKSSMERTESVGITDVEKIVNHGFDAKTSFRGKPQK